MKLTDIFTKSQKTVETTGKVLEKAQEELNKVQAEVAEKQMQKQQIQQAMNVISAHLVIDPTDKNATAQKNKAESKVAEIDKEIVKLNEKAQKAQVALTKAQKEYSTSKGEVFKQEHTKAMVAYRFNNELDKMLKAIESKLPNYPHSDWVEWSRAYGLPVQSYSTPSGSVAFRELAENVPFLREQRQDAEAVSGEKAKELISKVEKFIEELLETEGIELKK
ncbi:hypothetical protein [Pseudobacillus badius]|uniref:hypothetical protein n=1 Tax=Bacillus badius TaxID=1455 RepID=UPI0007B3E4E7|nr:hypothetical protein [Bacillus badius]KZR56960.1 hypothetical protein A3781_04610 [Bacillus badius]